MLVQLSLDRDGNLLSFSLSFGGEGLGVAFEKGQSNSYATPLQDNFGVAHDHRLSIGISEPSFLSSMQGSIENSGLHHYDFKSQMTTIEPQIQSKGGF